MHTGRSATIDLDSLSSNVFGVCRAILSAKQGTVIEGKKRPAGTVSNGVQERKGPKENEDARR